MPTHPTAFPTPLDDDILRVEECFVRKSLPKVAETFLALGSGDNDRGQMRQILETEEHVVVPPFLYADPFYRITHLIKEQIRKYKWIEGEKGRALSWEQARTEWTEAHRKDYENYLVETLVPAKSSAQPENPEQDSAEAPNLAQTGVQLSKLPHRTGA